MYALFASRYILPNLYHKKCYDLIKLAFSVEQKNSTVDLWMAQEGKRAKRPAKW